MGSLYFVSLRNLCPTLLTVQILKNSVSLHLGQFLTFFFFDGGIPFILSWLEMKILSMDIWQLFCKGALCILMGENEHRNCISSILLPRIHSYISFQDDKLLCTCVIHILAFHTLFTVKHCRLQSLTYFSIFHSYSMPRFICSYMNSFLILPLFSLYV